MNQALPELTDKLDAVPDGAIPRKSNQKVEEEGSDSDQSEGSKSEDIDNSSYEEADSKVEEPRDMILTRRCLSVSRSGPFPNGGGVGTLGSTG
ncbi:Hypothetical predicted protein [Pelobates cultripes]|uniref:Uncharacterized protein n=1 Tax=Pelobates cultripes TaxID=61616 RepID=A0AAD1WEA3_PELCU|nr:Hypothetical predicted protein [Pelobates cultripes]